jgi:hypothetical protein
MGRENRKSSGLNSGFEKEPSFVIGRIKGLAAIDSAGVA